MGWLSYLSRSGSQRFMNGRNRRQKCRRTIGGSTAFVYATNGVNCFIERYEETIAGYQVQMEIDGCDVEFRLGVKVEVQ